MSGEPLPSQRPRTRIGLALAGIHIETPTNMKSREERRQKKLDKKAARHSGIAKVASRLTAQQSLDIRNSLELAMRHHSAGDLTNAERIYKQILRINPNHADALNLLGLHAYQAGKYDRAEKLIIKAIKTKPDFAEAHNHLGLTLQKQGRLEEAAVSFRKTITLAPGFNLAVLNLGNVLLDLGRSEDAVGQYHKVISREPKFVNAHYNLGNALKKLGQFENAATSYRNAIEIAPNFAEAHSNLGNVLQKLGEQEDAIIHYREAISLSPGFAEAHYNLGITLMEAERPEEAIDQYNKAIAIQPGYADAHESLGNAFKKLGRLEDAVHHYDLAEINSSRLKSLECLYALERYDAFYEKLDSLIEVDEKNVYAAALSTFVSHQLGRFNPHTFCKTPLAFVRGYMIHEDAEVRDAFLNDLLDEVKSRQADWEPKGKTTRGGFQTPSDLFKDPKGLIVELDRIIREKIEDYRSEFRSDDCDFVRQWPNDGSLQGWSVRLLNGGAQAEHIHPDGWLSGVLYLQVPKFCQPDEGTIEFGLWGYDYPILNEDYPKKRLYPENGKIVLFPSSLFHKTIPFQSDEERICIAFDLIPGKDA